MAETEEVIKEVKKEYDEKELHAYIRKYSERIEFLRSLPEEVNRTVYSMYFGWNSELSLTMCGEDEQEQAELARHLLGTFIKAGWTKKVVKKDGYEDQDDTMFVSLTKSGLDRTVRIDGYMAKTCKIIEREVVIPAEEEQLIPAKPEKKVIRKIIQCDGFDTELLSETEVK